MNSGFADAQTLYQHQQLLQQQLLLQHEHRKDEQAQSLLHQQQRPELETPYDESSLLQTAFVAPSALSSGPEVASAVTSGRHSSASTQSSSVWKDSPKITLSELFSSPASSVVSPQSSDVSPPTPVDPLNLGPSQKQQKQQPTETAETPRRRRGRPRLSEASARAAAAVGADGGEGTAAGAKKKLQKKAAAAASAAAARRKSNASTTSGADEFRNDHAATTTNDDKKNRIRARNREAAYKCRKKKQKGIEQLQTQEAVAESVHKNLAAEAAALRSEILMLKSMVLQHGGCGCSYIEEYISGAAANLVQSSGVAPATTTPTASKAPDAASGHDEGLNAQQRQQQAGCMMGESGGIDGGDGYVDWNMFDVERSRPAAVPGLGSESGFSAFDDSAAHSVRSQSQGAMMA